MNLRNDETLIKENIYDGLLIDWIKVNERNKCIIIGSYNL